MPASRAAAQMIRNSGTDGLPSTSTSASRGVSGRSPRSPRSSRYADMSVSISTGSIGVYDVSNSALTRGSEMARARPSYSTSV